MNEDVIALQWIYETLGALVKEPTEENRRIVAKVIYDELNKKEISE